MENKKGKILCVDDEPNILRSLQWLLQKEFEVHTAISGQDGLALIAQHDFDAVVSDQRMPGMMGSEFLREVRLRSPRTMRMLLTGYSDLPAILRSVNEGEVFRFIHKPWKFNELMQVVGEAVQIAQATEPETVGAAPVEAESEDDGGDSILVVDDDPDNVERMLQEAGHQSVNVRCVTNIADAVSIFDTEDVGIILSDTKVDSVDTTRMLKVIKEKHPEIVTVVYTANSDADEVINLINQGQIFRFILKPVKPTTLMLAMTAAKVKRTQLRLNPAFAKRHRVQGVNLEMRESLVDDLASASPVANSAAQTDAPPSKGGLFRRVTGSFWQMLGGKNSTH
jgi:serine/threonine-protein kinase